MALTQEQIIDVCIATFDAAPGAANLASLQAWADANPDATVVDLAEALGALPEFSAQFDGMDTAAKAAAMASHFGLTAGTQGGDAAIAYFTQELNAGTSEATMLGNAVDFLLNTDEATLSSLGLTDAKTVLENKEAVAKYYSVDKALSGDTIADLQAVVANVTADSATVTAAETSIGDKVVAEKGQTYSISTDKTAVTEGNSIDFTVSIGTAVSTDTTVNYHIEGVEVAGGTADPLSDIGVVNGTVVIPAGQTTGTITLTPTSDGVTEGYEGFKVSILDSNFNAVATSANVVIEDPANAGQTFTLTTSVDGAPDFTGGDGDDTYNATDLTATALDNLDGGAGNDTLNMNDTAGGTDIGTIGMTVSNIETINLRSAGAANITTTSGFTGLNTINVTQGTASNVSSATTTDINVSGITGTITVDGGKDVAVTDNNVNANITIGATTAPAGAITVTDAKQGTGTIAVDGGTDVTINSTTTLANASGTIAEGTITVGATTAPTGAVNITNTLTSDATSSLTGGAIAVTGGTQVNVTINATQTAKNSAATGQTLTNGAVTVTADNNTTAVNVTQTYSETEVAASTTGNVTESASVKFGALKNGDALTITDPTSTTSLTFTASQDLTAAEVAAVFADLTNPDTQSSGGVTDKGIYTGSLAGWTSADANGDTVVFTSATADTNVTDLTSTITGTSTAPTITTTQGAGGTTTVATANSGVFGAVTIDDNTTASITTITVDGYGANATLGGGGSLDALTDLTLKNANSGTATLTTAQTALNLNVDNVNAAVSVDGGGATITDLNLTTSGTKSAFGLTAAAIENLTINAGVDLDISTGSSLGTAMKTATISGAGAVDLGNISAEVALNSFDATANTGGVTATVETDATTLTGTLSEYKFSAGDDNVTTVATTGSTVDVNITTGAGDDTVTLFTGVTGFATGKTIDAGAGDADTLSMAAADLTTVTGSNTFQDGISGFERVTVGAIADNTDDATPVNETLDLANLDNINYVNVSGISVSADGTTASDGDGASLAISNLGANGTVNLTAAITNDNSGTDTGSLSIALADATGTSDVLNLKMTDATDATGITNTGTVTANDIETININVSDKFVDANDDGKDDGTATHTLILSTDSATTYNITGNSNLNLTYTDTALTAINASSATGALTATASNDSMTITGGSAGDSLTATGSQDTLLGGAGNDTLTAGDLTTLTGGDGNDIFVMTVPTNVNSYSTITDATSGDIISIGAGAQFTAAGITLASTAVFQDYANAAVNVNDANGAATWFNYGGDTYIVIDANNSDTDFNNGVDSIIKIAGVVDLGADASYNQTVGSLEIS